MTSQATKEKEVACLKKRFTKLLNHIIEVAKGRAWNETFYHLLTSGNGAFLPVKMHSLSKEEIRYALENAWWIEEEDVRQHFLTHIWQHKITSKANLDFIFALELRRYLIKQKALIRQTFNQEKYQQYLKTINKEENKDIGRPLLFKVLNPEKQMSNIINKVSLFERYLIYLVEYTKEMEISKLDTMADLLITHRRQVLRWLNYLEKRLEKNNEA